MDEELLKKILGAAGVKDVTPDILKAASQAAQTNPAASPTPPATSQVDAVKQGLAAPTDPYLAQEQKSAPIEENIARRFADSDAGFGQTISSKTWDKDMRKLQDTHNTEMAKIRQEEYGRAGMEDPRAKEFAPYLEKSRQNDIDSGKISRLDAYKEKNKSAQAEASRRDGIRDSNSIDISKNISDGLTGRQIFQDDKGRVEGPAELKARLMKEGSDINDATIAAGERYRDMFGLPNAKSEGFGMRGGQRDAVMNAPKGLREDGTSPRMDVMAKLKDARTDNLKSLTEQRLADPNRKPVGTITSIESSDGRVLAKRGEGEAVVAKGGLQGAMGGTEDLPGALTVTRAGENAIRDRLTVQETSAPTDKPLSGSRVITGRYGTAIGGTRVLDKLKNDGTVPKDFKTTPITEKATVDAIARPPLQSAGELTTRDVTRTVGQAPLPEKYAEGRDKLLAGAGQTAKSQGSVVGDAKPLLDRMAPGTAQAIDQKSDKIAADLKQQKEDKLGSDFLNAYKASGGKVNAPKPGTPSPGPRTDQEKAAMQAFVNKDDELKRRLARR
jgi:hypothetical protein